MTQRFTIERPQNQQVFKGGADPWRRNDKPRNKPCTVAEPSYRCCSCNCELTSWELFCPVCGALRNGD